jgi:hypothetical protein
MKNILILLLIVFTALSCSNNKNDGLNRNIILNDTITTTSGLKYIFLKEGKGRKIEIGSKVKAYYDLYINDADTIVESTSIKKDSIFEFIHGASPVIKGFSELNNYLVEGDEVIAIIPDSLAYGEESNETLIYNPYIVKYVPEPKEMLNDTLYTITSTENAKNAIKLYEKVLNGDLKNRYHTDLNQMIDLMKKLSKDSLHSESEYLADYFSKKTEDGFLSEYFISFKLAALEGQGEYEEAIALIEPLIERGNYKELWQKHLKRLKEKLDN